MCLGVCPSVHIIQCVYLFIYYLGFAYIEYHTPENAQNAMKHMDGGQIDGQVANSCII